MQLAGNSGLLCLCVGWWPLVGICRGICGHRLGRIGVLLRFMARIRLTRGHRLCRCVSALLGRWSRCCAAGCGLGSCGCRVDATHDGDLEQVLHTESPSSAKETCMATVLLRMDTCVKDAHVGLDMLL